MSGGAAPRDGTRARVLADELHGVARAGPPGQGTHPPHSKLWRLLVRNDGEPVGWPTKAGCSHEGRTRVLK